MLNGIDKRSIIFFVNFFCITYLWRLISTFCHTKEYLHLTCFDNNRDKIKINSRNHLYLVSCALMVFLSCHIHISFASNSILTIINSNCAQFTECPVSHSPFSKKCTKEEKFCQLNEVKIFSLLYPSNAVLWIGSTDLIVLYIYKMGSLLCYLEFNSFGSEDFSTLFSYYRAEAYELRKQEVFLIFISLLVHLSNKYFFLWRRRASSNNQVIKYIVCNARTTIMKWKKEIKSCKE